MVPFPRLTPLQETLCQTCCLSPLPLVYNKMAASITVDTPPH